MEFSQTVEITVPFHDVDMMQVAWHGHYAKYFEIARCQLLDSFDYNYRQMEQSGYMWPIVDFRIKYIRPAKFEASILVSATLVEYENRLKIAYRIKDKQTGETLTKGHTVQMAVKLSNHETCFRSPSILFDKLGVEVEDE
ncbi:acyl-CoA thioesterase [Spartinivicinus ruber]|uniref:acyl-CoA thioesterase n=1 Tax=Spartinivicinus ruber TaxID=2683272 RepID=UPI0013D40EE8|nr:thioesterase family protein [Spartinivicinus ruber]